MLTINKLYTCSKHNYTGLGQECPDCQNNNGIILNEEQLEYVLTLLKRELRLYDRRCSFSGIDIEHDKERLKFLKELYLCLNNNSK